MSAANLSEQDKLITISSHFKKIMEALGLDLNDESLSGTPDRVAKMYLQEMFSGLDIKSKPACTCFPNDFNYKQMIVEKNISVVSVCEHHFVPIIGKAHVAYFSDKRIIGLSKINRIVDYYSKRPQVQERLTVQIAEELKSLLDTKDVAVMINADHHCVSYRGIKDLSSATSTFDYDGKFLERETRSAFFESLKY